MDTNTKPTENPVEYFDNIYYETFKKSPIYKEIFANTIKNANSSYQLTIYLSLVIFIVGIILMGLAIFAFFRNSFIFSGVFSIAGIVNLVALFLYRPIDRIQAAVNKLIQSQIACLSFHAQYNTLYKMMYLESNLFGTNINLKVKQDQMDLFIKGSNSIRDATTKLIEDLNSIEKSSIQNNH